MRNIKFKAKIKDKFIYSNGLLKHKDGVVIMITKENEENLETSPVEVDTICQYTGFKDSHGKEIYEGDILSDWIETDEGSIQSKCQVFWNEIVGGWHLDLSSDQDKSYYAMLYKDLIDFEYEITGNIYESK